MDTAKLAPILNKESILKTASARELQQAPQDVLNRYDTYAATHVPLGDTTNQVNSLRRVITQNKHCAVGTIVGPYGYGKTSTAVHLWSELRDKKILAVPPFQWSSLQDLLDAVFYWARFEFSLGPKTFIEPLEQLYDSYRERELSDLQARFDPETVRELAQQGRLLLGTRPEDFITFCTNVCQICLDAGYDGLAVFTDELQATIAAYQPSRDQFYADLFQIVKDILGLTGQWTLVMTMDDGTEGIIARDRADMLQRMQRSALYFRVRDVYNRREYPAELWAAFEERFQFDGGSIIPSATLESIGQVAAREDLGAGPRMVTHAFSLAVRHFGKSAAAYTPINFVDDFLAGQMVFDQRGKFTNAVKKALANPEIRDSEVHQDVVKLLSAYPMGCSDALLEQNGLLRDFQSFPPLARQELVLRQAGGYIIRYLAEEEVEPEQIEQRLTKDFINRYAPSKAYAERAAQGFVSRVLLEQAFTDWRVARTTQVNLDGQYYDLTMATGTFDPRYPNREVAITVATVRQSPPPNWRKAHPDAQMELRFELNYELASSEPNRLLVSSELPDVAIFQFNLARADGNLARRVLPDFLHEYYSAEQLTPQLILALIHHLDAGAGERPDDRQRVGAIVNVLRQFVLQILLNDQVETLPADYASGMVGVERIKDVFRQMVRTLFPEYSTLITNKRWQENLQQYNYALQSVTADDGISIARGRRAWTTTKDAVADAFRIPGRRLTNLESLLDVLDPLILKEKFSGRTSDSEVELRFQLHPLEQDWLEKIDGSGENHWRNGIEVSAMPAEVLIRDAKEKGYTDSEIKEILRLLQTRKFVDWEQRRNLLIRAVDDIGDLHDAVAAQLEQLESNVRMLADTVPDFDPTRYPLQTLRDELNNATERDQIEEVKAQIRKYSTTISAYTSTRLTRMHETLKHKQDELFSTIQTGLPKWLAQEMPNGPFHDVLEQQRGYVTSSYDEILSELRTIRERSVGEIRELPTSNADAIHRLSEIIRSLDNDSEGLRRRLQTYEEYHTDLDKWRQVAEYVAKLEDRTAQIEQKYAHSDFRRRLHEICTNVKERMHAQPLDAMGMWKLAYRNIKEISDEVMEWQGSRRQDFELRCREYQQSLALAGLNIDLAIPFDPDNPTESYNALTRTVRTQVDNYLQTVSRRLNRNLQILRYGLRVQNLPLRESEQRGSIAQQRLAELKEVLRAAQIDELGQLQSKIIEPLAQVVMEEHHLEQDVSQSLQKRPAAENEIRVMSLLEANAKGEQIDLRSLILSLIEQNNNDVDLDRLMHELQSLFQKNQISLTIGIL